MGDKVPAINIINDEIDIERGKFSGIAVLNAEERKYQKISLAAS